MRNLANSEAKQGEIIAGFPAIGVSAETLPTDVLRELERITERVLTDEAAKDPDFAAILESQREFRSSYAHWKARAYLPSLDLHDVQMSAAESALGHTLVEITGVIGNLGDKPIESVKLNCVFYEINGIELHRVRSTIVRSSVGLPPGDERNFRLAFDAIPDGWNQVMPNLFIAEIIFVE